MKKALPERIRPSITALKRLGPMRPGKSGISKFPLTVPPRWWIPSHGILLPTHSAGSSLGFLSNSLVLIEDAKLARLIVKARRISARAASRTSRPPPCIPLATAVRMARWRSRLHADNWRGSSKPEVVSVRRMASLLQKIALQLFDGALFALGGDGDHADELRQTLALQLPFDAQKGQGLRHAVAEYGVQTVPGADQPGDGAVPSVRISGAS